MAIEAMQVTEKQGLLDVRAELGLSQEVLALKGKVSRSAIVRAERGMTIQRISAYKILSAINKAREQKGMPLLSIRDLDWKIQGEHENSLEA